MLCSSSPFVWRELRHSPMRVRRPRQRVSWKRYWPRCAVCVQHKRELARVVADLQRLNTEEASVAAEAATEQGRWTEINQRLEELERALTRR